MDSFVKIFSAYGSGGIERLENEINEFARRRNLDIVSANPCFRKAFIDADGMHIVVVFKNKYTEDGK
jgi:hypothetical protein